MEKLIWLMPDLAPDYNPKDAHFLGQPIDYVIFDGLDEGRAEIDVVFLEVKTGTSPVSHRQRAIQEAISEGRVRWQVLRLPGTDVEPPAIDWSTVTATFADPEDARDAEWQEDPE